MTNSQSPWPREWLMTDERLGDRLWEAIDALPDGGGIVFRHYATAPEVRREIAKRIAKICAKRALTLAVAGDVVLAEHVGAHLLHNPASAPAPLSFSRSAHTADETAAAVADGAALIFLSPMFPTQSHPGQPTLGREIARTIVSSTAVPVIALGGMNRARFAELESDGFYGWAGIDAWLAGPPRDEIP